jgi:hypothetical protein
MLFRYEGLTVAEPVRYSGPAPDRCRKPAIAPETPQEQRCDRFWQHSAAILSILSVLPRQTAPEPAEPSDKIRS